LIGYRNQGIKLLPYNAPTSRYTRKQYALQKTSSWGRLRMACLYT